MSFFQRCLSLAFWASALAGLLASVLGLSAFAAPDVWWADNMSFFLIQFLAAGLAGTLLCLLGLVQRRRFPILYRTIVAAASGSFLCLALLFVDSTGQNLAARAPDSSAGDALKIVSINLEGLFLGDPVLQDYLETLKPDIIVLQETLWWLQERRWRRLQLTLGSAGVNGFPDHLEVGRLGSLVVYARLPILEVASETVEAGLSRGARIYHDSDREILSLKLGAQAGTFDLVAVHSESPRTKQRWDMKRAYFDRLDAALTTSRFPSSGPMMVIGDWNSSPWSSRFHQTLAAAGLGTRYPGGWPQPTRFFFDYRLRWLLGAPVDQFAVSPDLQVVDVSLGPDIGSDHRPLVVEVKLP